MKKILLGITLVMVMALLLLPYRAKAVEVGDLFILQDIEYNALNGIATLNIKTNEEVNYIVYVLEEPHRIVVDPLNTIWCDFEDRIYFQEGMVKSIKFIKARSVPGGPGASFYPCDFVTIELNQDHPYEFLENEVIATLKIGQLKLPVTDAELSTRGANMLEEEFAQELAYKEDLAERESEEARAFVEKEARIKEEQDYISKKKAKIDEQEAKIDEQETKIKEEAGRLASIKEEITEEKLEINLAKDELEKEKAILEDARARLNEESSQLEDAKSRLDEQKEELKKEGLAIRPISDYLDREIPPDFLSKELTLNDCINVAVSNSIEAKIAKEKVKLASLKVNEAFRELFPEFSLIWDETRGRITGSMYKGRKFGAEFRQPVFHGGELMNMWEQSKVSLKISKENLNKVKEEIVFNTTKAYYELAKSMNKYKHQENLFEDAAGDFEIAKKEYEFALISEIDFMNIESVMNQATHVLVQHENSLSLARLELNKVMNVDIDAIVTIDEKLLPKEMDIELGNCTELAMKFKPEHRISYLNTETAKLTERIAKGQTFPQVDVFGKFLRAAEQLEPFNLYDLNHFLDNEKVIGGTVSIPWGPNTIEYQKKIGKLAPTVTTFESNTQYDIDKVRINLFDNMARASNIKDASISYKQALDELNKSEQSIHMDIRQAIFSFQESKLKIDSALNNIQLYTRELEVATVRKGLNEISFYDLIQAKTKLYNEKTAYTDAVGDYYIAIARVNKAIGMGGYFN